MFHQIDPLHMIKHHSMYLIMHAEIMQKLPCIYTLQKLKYDIHTKLSLESYQIQFWYDSSGNFWYKYHISVFALFKNTDS